MEWRLFLQAYVDAADYPQAFEAARALIERLAPRAAIRECRVRPYYKFQNQYGVWLDFGVDDPPAAFDALLADLAQGWARTDGDSERVAIWDHRLHGPAALPALRWLHLNLFPEPGPTDDF